MVEKKQLLRLGLVSLAAITAGAAIGLALNYQTLKEYRSPQVEVPANPAEPVEEEHKIATYSGTIKPADPSIYAEGTHFLENAAGEVITILQSAKIDLSFFEGQTVEVEGTVKDSVEGNQTVLEVEKILL